MRWSPQAYIKIQCDRIRMRSGLQIISIHLPVKKCHFIGGKPKGDRDPTISSNRGALIDETTPLQVTCHAASTARETSNVCRINGQMVPSVSTGKTNAGPNLPVQASRVQPHQPCRILLCIWPPCMRISSLCHTDKVVAICP